MRLKPQKLIFGLLLSFLLANPLSSYAGIDHLVATGFVIDNLSEEPLDGFVQVQFNLYDGCTADGELLSSESQLVEFENGLYSALVKYNSSEVIASTDLCLGVQIEDDEEMSPRMAFYPAAYAIHATHADTAETATVANVAMTLSSSNVGSGLSQSGNSISLDTSSSFTWSGSQNFTQAPSNTNSSSATLRVNPNSSVTNAKYFAVQNNGSDLFTVDREGDVEIAGNVTITGSLSGVSLAASSIANDSLDFSKMEDTLDLDAATEINLGAFNYTIDLDSTGDFLIADAGTTKHTFADDGSYQAAGNVTFDKMMTLTRTSHTTLNASGLKTITPTASYMTVNVTDGSNVTVSSIATTGMSAGTILYLTNTDTAESVTLSSSSTTNLSVSSDITLTQNQTTGLIFNGTNWIQLSGSGVGANSVSSSSVQDGTISASDLASNSVASDEIAADAVGSSEIAANAVTASEIATDAVGSDEIAADAVGSSEIAANAVGTSEIATGAVTTTEILDGTIANADISSSAAIDYSKLATLTSGNIIVGNSSNVATSVNPSGDVDISNTGAFTIQSNAVTLGTDTTGNYVATVSGNSQVAVSGSGSESATVSLSLNADSLDFSYFEDALNLDAATSVSLEGYDLDINLNSTGEFAIQDGGSDILHIADDTGETTISDDLTLSLSGTENLRLTNSGLTSTSEGMVHLLPSTSSSTDGTNYGFYMNFVNTDDSNNEMHYGFYLNIDNNATTATDGVYGLTIDNEAGVAGTVSLLRLDNSDSDTAVTNAIEIVDAGGGFTNMFSIAGVNISFSEIGLLDGKNATLVDLNDSPTWAGAHNFGMATSVAIPNGSAPTVDATGEIAIDTTDDQLVYFGSSNKRVIPYIRTKSIVLESPSDSDNFLLWRAPDAITVTNIHCIVDPYNSSESAVLGVFESDSNGDFTNLATNGLDGSTTISCDNDGANDDGSLSNATVDAGDWIGIDVGSITGTVSHLTITIQYTTDAQ